MVVAADTIVVHNNQILEKPANPAEALNMLRGLCNDEHEAITAVAILLHSAKDNSIVERVFTVTTRVRFGDIDEDILQAYIDTYEPMYVHLNCNCIGCRRDKAGAYGLQGLASMFVEEIHGDFYNVVCFLVFFTRLDFLMLSIYIDWISCSSVFSSTWLVTRARTFIKCIDLFLHRIPCILLLKP